MLAVYDYGYSQQALYPKAYVTSDDNAFGYVWISGGAFEVTSKMASRADQANEEARSAPLLDIEWSYQLDPLSSIFILITTGVGLCIFVFALGYMHGDERFHRFFAYMGFFIFSMLMLTLSANFLLMFVGWEGVGLCSYLLIGYHFDRREANDAARKAFIANRIGAFGFILAIAALIATFGTTQFVRVMEAARPQPFEAFGVWGMMSWIALGLFIGAVGKSAQIPLYVWLPDAMAGPTPLSALIHAATMVTAGVYLLARANVIFQHSQTMMFIAAVTGAATALLAASIAMTQNDIKKVLAYSTISQLGLMFLACGVGAFILGVFHVMTHAFFKALLFLGAGSVIHAMHHEQDLRRMGGLGRYMPHTYRAFLIGWLAICAIIPLSGFWSKDEILSSVATASLIAGGSLLWLIGIITTLCTALYMTRLVALVFFGAERFTKVSAGGEADEAYAHGYDEGEELHDAQTASVGDRPHHAPGEHVGIAYDASAPRAAFINPPSRAHEVRGKRGAHAPHESPPVMWIPLMVLAVLTTIGGFVSISPAFEGITGSQHPGGRANITNWLQPMIWNPHTGHFGDPPKTEKAAGGIEQRQTPSPYVPSVDVKFSVARAVERAFGSQQMMDWFFILISLFAAVLGVGLGWRFYVLNPQLPSLWAARMRSLYQASLHKYWVDELYGAVFTRRVIDAARTVHAIDSRVIDGAINGLVRLARRSSILMNLFDRYAVDNLVKTVATFVTRLMSPALRAAQTGLAQNYALAMMFGLVVAIILYFWF